MTKNQQCPRSIDEGEAGGAGGEKNSNRAKPGQY